MTTNLTQRIFLSPPHMSPVDRTLLIEAFDSNWIAPCGPQVDAFEREFAEALDIPYAVALSSGTAALHLALLAAGVDSGDTVLTSTLTFVATANAIRYVGANPVFIDSDRSSWNMDPGLLETELKRLATLGQCPAAVVTVDILGQCADYERIAEICRRYGVPLIEDAAESLGATYGDQAAGTLGDIGCFSFNGNKIITTSGGGMLVTREKKIADYVRHLASQARRPVSHYEHEEIGFNYRLSGLLSAVGRGQLSVLTERVKQRRANFQFYHDALKELPGIEFMPEASFGYSTRWLTAMLVNPDQLGVTADDLRLALETENIEARRIWKPMHLQPVYADCRVCGGNVSDEFFEYGLCLPSGSSLTEEDRERVVKVILATVEQGLSKAA
ncbi:MAG: aminotransferase class I/II-fold pyridoxal phosphate-dependent enzyme [Planctomycetes bacterium]|nr:aminotransferase class I/II-fold pyridoxal phosphate-dependent enzyme [Planctomycetota bacterium]